MGRALVVAIAFFCTSEAAVWSLSQLRHLQHAVPVGTWRIQLDGDVQGGY